MAKNSILTVDSVTKSFGGSRILDGISFDAVSGETLGILGPSGSGRSTLMRVLGGLVMPDDGDVIVAGTSLYRDYEKCMTLIGYVPECPAFYDYMTCIDNLRTFADMYVGITKQRIDDVIIQLGLGEYAYERMSSCPTSVRYRLGVAAAIIHSPRILLLSNLLDGLDPVAIVDLRRTIHELSINEGLTTIITSRLIGELERMCDRVMVLNNGKMVGIGTVSGLKNASTGKLRHRLLLDQPDSAARYLMEVEKLNIEVRGDMLIIDADQSAIPRLINMLFARGYLVYEVTPIELTLEEAYYHLLRDWSRSHREPR